MDELITYLNAMDQDAQHDFASRCGTSVGYIRKAASIKQKFGESLCINFERESKGAIRCETIRPDVDWAYLRGTKRKVAA